MTDPEKRSLHSFCIACDQLAASTFGSQFKVAFTKSYFVQPNTYYSTRIREYDDDAFRSFLLTFRKLLLEKEPANLNRVLNILSKYGSAEDRKQIKLIRSELRTVEHAGAYGVRSAVKVEGAEDYRAILPKEALKAYFNGILFHDDDKHNENLEFYSDNRPFAKLTMLHYIVFVHKQALRLAGAIVKRGFIASTR